MLTEAFRTITDRPVVVIEDVPDMLGNLLEGLFDKADNTLTIATMKPCPCGNFTHPQIECHCTPYQIQRYLSKIPGYFRDLMDIHLEVPKISDQQITDRRSGEESSIIKERIIQAGWTLCSKELDKEAEELLKMAILEIGISAKAYDKIDSIAKTIARLDNKKIVEAAHISEAIGYRSLDRNLWT